MTASDDLARPGPLERLGDRLNPILVKEVRQALRGRYFRLSFSLTLLAASVISMGWLVFRVGTLADLGAQPLGPSFYTINFACIVIATHGLVPFSAFMAMGSEWDENTYDLLVLSNLRPRQIVLGKVFSAGVQALLYYSAFGPFLVFAFLLRGVDLLVLLVTLGASLITSFALSCLAVALSSLARQRFLRVTLMGGLAAFLITAVITPSITSASLLMRFPGQLREPEAMQALLGMLTLFLAVGVFFVLIASARLAHPEENQSTGLRIYSLLLPLLFLGWMTVMSLETLGFEEEVLLASALAAQLFVALAALFFTTEAERLGRRVRHQVPRRKLAAILSAPFLPGGGRGLAWFVLGTGLVLAWLVGVDRLAAARSPGWKGFTTSEWLVLPVVAGMAFVDLGLASLVLSGRTKLMRFRIAGRLLGIVLFLAVVLLPALLGFFLGREDLMRFEHAYNPLYIVYSLITDDLESVPGAPLGVALLAALVLVANSLRLGRGLREVWSAHARPAAPERAA